jgi:hypothetical protein
MNSSQKYVHQQTADCLYARVQHVEKTLIGFERVPGVRPLTNEEAMAALGGP